MPFGEGGYRTSFWPTDREMRRSVFDFHFPKFQNLESARGLVYNFFQNQRRGGERIIQVSVLGAWLPSLLWGESITTPFGFLGAIVVQSTGHQFRMLLAKTAPLWQDHLTPVWKREGGGCQRNPPIKRLIEDAGFELECCETGYMSGPKPMTFMYEGSARPR